MTFLVVGILVLVAAVAILVFLFCIWLADRP